MVTSCPSAVQCRSTSEANGVCRWQTGGSLIQYCSHFELGHWAVCGNEYAASSMSHHFGQFRWFDSFASDVGKKYVMFVCKADVCQKF